ncbi:sugar kinase [Kordiimonas sp.]|uniref:sugar kinase n=1 Tax=Kordiimonas sp. TaxID=1970157 RepID=UPI003A91FCC5
MTKAVFIGECMVEFSPVADATYRRSFAGDTYNAAVYMKRCLQGQAHISYMTAVGDDTVSDAMISSFMSEGLDCGDVYRLTRGTPGAYMISTDNEGERSFSYWRRDAAAKEMVRLMRAQNRSLSKSGADLIFFSGISLAILDDDSRAGLLDDIAEARDGGATIAFDPNYRPRLWESADEARHWLDRAYRLTDIAFPGMEEEGALYSTADPYDALERMQVYGCKEIVLKAGDAGMFVRDDSMTVHLPFTPARQVVDTTAAGDSFDGAYLAAWLEGADAGAALRQAAEIAAVVVGLPGAIAPRAEFDQARDNLT